MGHAQASPGHPPVVLQASPARWGDLAPTFEELNDPSFQKLMVEMSAFKRLVESGAISGFEADAWKKVTAEEA